MSKNSNANQEAGATTTAAEYKAKVVYTSRQVSAKEKIQLANFTGAVSLDTEIDSRAAMGDEARVYLDVDFWATVQVHNEMSKDNKDYSVLLIVTKDGTTYKSGSDSLVRELSSLEDQLADARAEGEEIPLTIACFKRPSRNYAGKGFITCELV